MTTAVEAYLEQCRCRGRFLRRTGKVERSRQRSRWAGSQASHWHEQSRNAVSAGTRLRSAVPAPRSKTIPAARGSWSSFRSKCTSRQTNPPKMAHRHKQQSPRLVSRGLVFSTAIELSCCKAGCRLPSLRFHLLQS